VALGRACAGAVDENVAHYLGTPAQDKKMVLSDQGHILTLDKAIPATLEWFDRYLSGKPAVTR